MPRPLLTVGIEMPDDFPSEAYEATCLNVSKWPERHPRILHEFVCAWNAVAYRFQSVGFHDHAYSLAVRQLGEGGYHLKRYIVEREIFNFFTNGLATIEDVYYALYAVGATLDSSTFPMLTPKDRKRATLERTVEKFNSRFTGEPITRLLQGLHQAPEFERFEGLRNILSHRLAFATEPANDGGRIWRNVELQVGNAIERPEIKVDETLTASRRKWIAQTLQDLITECAAWTSRIKP